MSHFEKRTLKNGRVVYRAVVKRAPFKPVKRQFDRLNDARKWAKRAETELLEKRSTPHELAQIHICADAFDRYIKDVLPTKRNAGYRRSMACHIRYWRRRFGKIPLSDMTPGEIAQGRDALMANGRGAATANRYLFTLSAVCNAAYKEWGWLPSNPVAAVKKMKEPPPPSRHLTKEEIEALFNAASMERKPVKLLILLALATGGRRTQLTEIERRDVDAERHLIHFERMKGGKSMISPILPELMQEVVNHMQGLPAKATRLFASDMRYVWERVRARAGLSWLRFHGLRHAFGSALNQAGANAVVIKSAMRHSDIKTSERYVHGYDRDVADMALKAQRNTLAQLLEGGGG